MVRVSVLRRLGLVVLQEQLLQRRWLADQAPHADGDEVPQHAIEFAGVHLAAHARSVDLKVEDARHSTQTVRRPRQIGDYRGTPEVPQFVERARLYRPAIADDGDSFGERLDLGQDMAGLQHRAPTALLAFFDHLEEDLLFHRIQPRRRLVENQQFHVGGQRGNECDLLSVALGVGVPLARACLGGDPP